MARLYEKWIDPEKSYRPHREARTAAYYVVLAGRLGRAVDALGRRPSGLAVLDFGMGWGHWSLIAKGFGCCVEGVEISPSRIRRAEKNGLAVVDASQLEPGRYDLIFCEQVLEHVPSPVETLRSLAGTLRAGGMVLIGVPDGWGVSGRLADPDWDAPKGSERSLNPVFPLEHINCFHRGALLGAAEVAGLVLDRRMEPAAPAASGPLYRRLRGALGRGRRRLRGALGLPVPPAPRAGTKLALTHGPKTPQPGPGA